ncbi:MAG: hypothetical protein JWQ35_2374 [Bacteriovoracaceae bacterium]|nr:hypothetical protein [Bacteriovoracaceae bacterium]
MKFYFNFIAATFCLFSFSLYAEDAAEIAPSVAIQMTASSSLELLKLILENKERNIEWAEALAAQNLKDVLDVKDASCVLSVLRPSIDSADMQIRYSEKSTPQEKKSAELRLVELAKNNQINCSINSQTNEIRVPFSLAKNLLKPWGGHLDKTSVEFFGATAENLYWSLRTSFKKHPGDSGMLASLVSEAPGGGIVSEEWVINQDPDGPTLSDISPLALGCRRNTDLFPAIDRAKQLYLEWAQQHPTPTTQEQDAYDKINQSYWIKVFGEKEGVEAYDDQLERKVRRLYQEISCVIQ